MLRKATNIKVIPSENASIKLTQKLSLKWQKHAPNIFTECEQLITFIPIFHWSQSFFYQKRGIIHI